MTREQQIEAEKILPKLEECRAFLDNACFYMGNVDINDPQYIKCRTVYDYICKAMDQF